MTGAHSTIKVKRETLPGVQTDVSVKAVVYGPLALHKPIVPKIGDECDVTHIDSGMLLESFPSYEQARAAVVELAALVNDYNAIHFRIQACCARFGGRRFAHLAEAIDCDEDQAPEAAAV